MDAGFKDNQFCGMGLIGVEWWCVVYKASKISRWWAC